MDRPLPRRRVIEAGGVGAALSLAGCNSFASQDPQSSDGGSGQARVTVFANLDQQALESYQSDLREQLQSGDVSQQEARQKAQQKKVELMEESIQSFEERASGSEDLEVADKVPQAGVLLVEGSAEAVVGTLGYEEVHGLLAESEFEQYRQRSGQAGGGGQANASGSTGGDGGAGDGDESAAGNESTGESA